jgi:hypothetical protein
MGCQLHCLFVNLYRSCLSYLFENLFFLQAFASGVFLAKQLFLSQIQLWILQVLILVVLPMLLKGSAAKGNFRSKAQLMLHFCLVSRTSHSGI